MFGLIVALPAAEMPGFKLKIESLATKKIEK